MQTTEGRMVLLGKSWKALQRTIGEALLGTNGMFDGLVQGATQALNSVKKLFKVPMSQKYLEYDSSKWE